MREVFRYRELEKILNAIAAAQTEKCLGFFWGKFSVEKRLPLWGSLF